MAHFVITCISALSSRLKSRNGQSLVEYALILSFISFLTIAVVSVMGTQIRYICAPIVRMLASL